MEQGDGAVDLVSASPDDNKIAWYPNLRLKPGWHPGMPLFTYGAEIVITNTSTSAYKLEIADIGECSQWPTCCSGPVVDC